MIAYDTSNVPSGCESCFDSSQTIALDCHCWRMTNLSTTKSAAKVACDFAGYGLVGEMHGLYSESRRF
jgi:hypothetical protein